MVEDSLRRLERKWYTEAKSYEQCVCCGVVVEARISIKLHSARYRRDR
jgi:hypothetical protein